MLSREVLEICDSHLQFSDLQRTIQVKGSGKMEWLKTARSIEVLLPAWITHFAP